jgi:hypothetical protein
VLQEDLGGFGDARLRGVGARLLDAMCQQPTTRIQALAQDRAEALAFGRFLDHDAVSHSEMLTTAARFTGRRAVERHVLAIQDTTEFNFLDTRPASAVSAAPATTATSACSCIRPSRSTRSMVA